MIELGHLKSHCPIVVADVVGRLGLHNCLRPDGDKPLFGHLGGSAISCVERRGMPALTWMNGAAIVLTLWIFKSENSGQWLELLLVE